MGKLIVAAAEKKRNWQIENLTCGSFLQNIARRVAVMRGFTLFKHCRGAGFKMPKNILMQFKDKSFGTMKLLTAIFISVILKMLEIIACFIGFSVRCMLLTPHRWQYSDKLANDVFCQVPSAWSTRWCHNRHVSWDGEPGLSETLAQLATAWYKVYCRIIGSPVVAAFLLPSHFLLCLFMWP